MYLLKITKHTALLFFLTVFVTTSTTLCADFRGDDYLLLNDNGYFQLKWEANSDAEVELQQSQSPDFKETTSIYQGVDRATFISGLNNGKYYYRVKEVGSSKWSPTYTVQVQHQSLTMAYTLFGLGAVVFLLTVLVIFRGIKQVKVSN